MGLPYHTHTFEVPEASQDEVDNRLQVQKFITPDKLPPIPDSSDFVATADIGVTVQAYDADLTSWAGVNPSSYSTTAQIAAAYQPLDADLTAWAAVNPSSYSTTAQIAAAYQPLDGDLTAIAGLSPTNDDIVQRKAGAWTNRTMAQLLADLSAVGTTFQPLDSDLTTIAGLTATTDNFIVSVASAWASRTPSQVRTTLGLVIGTDVQAYSSVLANTTASFTTADETKLDAIEALADVTDATNVAAAGAVMNSLLTTRGDIITRGASAPQRLALGTSGYYLKSDGTDVVWAAAAAGGYGRRHKPIMASEFIPRLTNGPAFGTIEMATNDNNYEYLAFDTTTQEFADYLWFPPASWDLGTITFKARWFHPSTTTNFGVAWQLAGIAISDNETMDVALGTVQTVTDTGGTTSRHYVTSESSAITVGGTPAAGDAVMLRVARVPANGSDTMAVDAYLLGIDVFYTENAATD